MVIVVLAFLVSLVARDLPGMLATVLLGATSMALVFGPASATMVISVAVAFGSLLMAVVCVFARRRQLMVERRLDDLESRFLRARTDLESFFLQQSRAARERRSNAQTETTEEGTGQDTADAASDRTPGKPGAAKS
jgi:uncharacterized membrane protein YccC